MPTDPRQTQRAQLRESLAVHRRLILRQTYQQIADSLFPCPAHTGTNGVPTCPDCERMYGNRGTAQRAVQRAIKRDYSASAAEREQLRDEQYGTMSLLLKQALRDALDQKASSAERSRATMAAVRVADRLARLTGVDAPTRVTVTDELDEEIRAALAELAELPVPTPAQLQEQP